MRLFQPWENSEQAANFHDLYVRAKSATMVTRISVFENGTLTERYFARFGDLERPSRLPLDEGLVHDKDIACFSWSSP